ncbi:MAG TPA: translocation/assembly module TamB domain-containing protein [Bacteroidales bacterium]|nr:translocation/assembly module TamB domain-containing protein [Bacteroidales bacterium]
MPTVAYFVLKQNKVQQYVVQKVSAKLSDIFGTSVTIQAANIDLFTNFHLKAFCMLDKRNDTLLYVPDFIIRPSAFTIASKQVGFDKIVMKNPTINFYIDSTRTINLQVIVDVLASKDTSHNKKGWVILFKDVEIENGDFRLKSYYHVNRSGINFTDLHLKSFNLHVKRFSNAAQGVEIKIKNLSGIDKSGFVLIHLAARLKINPENMVFNDLELITPYSNIDADQIRLNFPSFKTLGSDEIFEKVHFYTDFNTSSISSTDLAYFVPFFATYPLNLRLSGSINGPINDLKGRDIEIEYGNATKISGNFDVSGLPNIKSSFLHVNIKNLKTTPHDIESIRIPNTTNGRIVFPRNFSQIAYISYKGRFTGFLSDFVAYGTIKTNLGTIESDLSFKPDTAHQFVFQGKLKMSQFQIGKYVGKEDMLGSVSLNANVKGRIWETKKFSAKLDGVITHILYNQYNYQNIKVDGSLTNNTYDGTLSITDPNLNMNFTGNVNLTGQIPIFNFSANVKHINLFKLNFDKKDTSSSASFLATANFEGNNIDNIQGEINLKNSTLRKTGKEIQINDFLLFTQTVNDTNRIIMRSELADAEIWGTYKFSELASSVKWLAKKYAPALINDTAHFEPSSNNFAFDIDLKNTQQLTEFFIPNFYVSKDTKLKGKYNPSKQGLSFLLTIPLLQHQNKKWYNVYFNGKAYQDSFSIISGCNNLKLSNQLRLDNFSIQSSIKKDSLDLVFKWNNWDSISYKGNISLKGYVSRNITQNKLGINFLVNPSQLILKDTLWTINTGLIKIDAEGYSVDQLTLSHKNQSIKATGRISNNESDIFSVDLRNVDLGNIKTIANSNKLNVEGVINGTAKFSDLLKNPEIYSSLSIDSLKFNGNMLGSTNLIARWNSLNKNITVNLSSKRNDLVTLNVKGNYELESKLMDFNITLDHLQMQMFEPYVANLFSDINGFASGALTLTGTIDSPLLNGNVTIPRSSLTVNYLKTKYKISNTFPIVNNTILFKNVQALDRENNVALINGNVEYHKLKDLIIDLKISTPNFLALNTSAKDNALFYGRAYASGDIRIKGMAPNIEMDINATTNKGTQIFIPLTARSELLESNFIHFVEVQKKENPFDKYEIDKREEIQQLMTNFAGLKMNFNLKATTDADMQIVFDQKIGDLIKGTGYGDLNLSIDGGNFKMFGTYTIEKGEYMFTLQNIINKKFDVESGGTITWSGDPLDASVNINAIYDKDRVKSSLYDLNHKYADYKNKLPVYCRIFMTEKLMSPTIKYDIYLPTADQSTRNLLANEINTEEELNKQFISLLFRKSFLPKAEGSSTSAAEQSTQSITAVGVTGIEFLSNQVSNWLSQISKDFDIGVNYHPGDEITNQEMEFALSTQMFNDRVTINGNVDVGGNKITQNSSNRNTQIVGDFDMDVKLFKSRKFRFKVFNRSKEDYTNELSYMQGIGISYKEDFNSFKELMQRYYRAFFTSKDKTTEEKRTEEKSGESEENTTEQTADSAFVQFTNKNH